MAIVIALAAMAAWPATASAREQKSQAATTQITIKLLKKQQWKSQSALNFWKNKGRPALYSQVEYCWEIAGKQRRQVCQHARKSQRYHQKRLPRIEARIEKLELMEPEIGVLADWICIHRSEGSWPANTGNGYFGGLQMDKTFQRTHGLDFYLSKGTANNWTPKEQIIVAERAKRGIYTSYSHGRIFFWQGKPRGYAPWPNTARDCGLL